MTMLFYIFRKTFGGSFCQVFSLITGSWCLVLIQSWSAVFSLCEPQTKPSFKLVPVSAVPPLLMHVMEELPSHLHYWSLLLPETLAFHFNSWDGPTLLEFWVVPVAARCITKVTKRVKFDALPVRFVTPVHFVTPARFVMTWWQNVPKGPLPARFVTPSPAKL